MSDDAPRHHRKRKSQRQRRHGIEYWNYFRQAWQHHGWYESRKQRDQALAALTALTKTESSIGVVLPQLKPRRYRPMNR